MNFILLILNIVRKTIRQIVIDYGVTNLKEKNIPSDIFNIELLNYLTCPVGTYFSFLLSLGIWDKKGV